MASPSPYDAFLADLKQTAVLGSAAGVLGWDQETLLPPAAIEHRGRQLAALAELVHERTTRDAFAERLAACEADAALKEDPDAQVNLRETRRHLDRATALPTDLVAETARTRSAAQAAWARARADNRFETFEPLLAKTVELARRTADAYNASGRYAEAWDALAEGYEPGLTAAGAADVFDRLTPPLVDFIREHRTPTGGSTPATDHRRVVPIHQQRQFIKGVLAALGFDFERGRLDDSAHPFCSGTHPTDVRLTTHFRDDDVFDALLSSIHEAGHGMYEQGLPAEHAYTPRGDALGLSIHESQSRLWENHVGRSSAFWSWALPRLQAATGTVYADLDAEPIVAALTRIEPGLIRIEADEATYHLHIVIRFRLERDLLEGRLAVADLPAAWNAAYAEALGVDVPDDARGCLQDIHWSMGAIGYFPTYTLGTLYAAQFWDAAEAELGSLDPMLREGRFEPLRTWLNREVHAAGPSDGDADALCRRVTGKPLDPDHFLAHLRRRYAGN